MSHQIFLLREVKRGVFVLCFTYRGWLNVLGSWIT